MKLRKTGGWILTAACGAALLGAVGIGSSALRAVLEPSTAFVGMMVRVGGTAGAGASVVVTAAGPRRIGPVRASAGSDGAFSLEIGPFPQAGTYAVAVEAAPDRIGLILEVIDRPAAGGGSAESPYSRALVKAADALRSTLDDVEQVLSPIPEGQPQMARVRQGLRQLRTTHLEIYRTVIDFSAHYARLRMAMDAEPDLRPAVRADFVRFEESSAPVLDQQAESLLQLGRGLANAGSEVCLAVAAAKVVLDTQKTILDSISQGLALFLTEKAQVGLGGTVAEWLGRAYLRVTPNALHPLPAERERLFSAAKTGLEAVLGLLSGGPWVAAAKILEGVVDIGLMEFSRANCMVFTGKMSGHTHVEAIENGASFYELDNDWEGTADIMSAKPSGVEPVKFRGYLRARGKNFTAVNGLRRLYPQAGAMLQDVTANPGRLESLQAVFLVPLEGTIAGADFALKALPGGADFVNLVKAHMAVVVIPAGSPVPLVQKYDIPYQGGFWQVQRALGPGGQTAQKIVNEPSGTAMLRKVRADLTREMSSAGARGRLTLKLDLCSGCDR